MAVQPFSVAELDRALAAVARFEARPVVAVAVSGGPDSMALAILADRWARQRGGESRALIVDHGLRPESGDEVRKVAAWLAARHIPHAVLVWAEDKPASGIQEAAREARYRLLEAWCREHGCLHLLTAHHREDQAETHLMRRRAGSGADGLAAMPVLRELAGCRLLRPLLAVPKARLLAVLRAEGQPFLEDPSNRDPRFERARLRRCHQGGLAACDLPPLLAHIDELAEQRGQREHAVNAWLARAAALHPAGIGIVDLASILAIPPELGERAMSRLLATLGGARYPVRRARVARLLAALATQPERGCTLGGCRLVPWRGRILVFREAVLAAPAAGLEPGARVWWDRRFVATLPEMAAQAVTLGHLGRDGVREIDPAMRSRASLRLPRFVHPILPAFRDAEGLLFVPQLGYRRIAAALPRLSFCPATALTHASFTVVSSRAHPIF